MARRHQEETMSPQLAFANHRVATTTSLQEVLLFQEEVISPFLENSRLPNKFEVRNWMGLQNGGLTFKDLPPQEAEQLIHLLGPSAFKVLRFSPDLLTRLIQAQQTGQPIITSGGSCLLTSADKGNWKSKPIPAKVLRQQILDLPHLMQIFDASLPILCADQHVNIIEDSLFVELGHECSVPALDQAELSQLFYGEGQRHSAHFQKLLQQFGSNAQVLPTNFSDLPVAERSEQFWQSAQVLNLIRRHSRVFFNPETAGQRQVMFSFTGAWADLLREVGHIPSESCYLVVEPFHHFTEAAERDQHVKAFSDRWQIYAGFDELMTAQPYGQPGLNAGIQGAVAFLPVLTPKGMLGHTNFKLEDCCSHENAQRFLEQRKSVLAATKIPSPEDNSLFTDGINYLFHLPDCREALRWLMQQTLTLRNETNRLDKRQRKELLKAFRSNPELLSAALERYALLYRELEKLVYSFFG